ncbi:unnamed protein product [Bemisia tabaci]|uniref:Heme haloperoxidase family profile domain-containing protein n=1 Tax=Bemisia tabaci TaxID=7038 RepID=A0A9P0F113_BEMTA|nr:unnamed protein product [Bemisia tabaci]
MRSCVELFALVLISQSIAVYPEVAQECPHQHHRQGPNLQIRDIKPTFNAKAQHVDVSGKHAFMPPGPTDIRGPCPGLNAMANHNYIPRNGIASLIQMLEGCYKVFGASAELCFLLAFFGCLYGGNGVMVSIGGPSDKVPHGPLPTPRGLSYTHNRFESDASPTRGDLHQYGDAAKLQLSQFKELLDMEKGPNPRYNLETLVAFYAKRLLESRKTNPYYFHPLIPALILFGAYQFIPELMSNKSAEYPEGFLDRETLKSFYAVSGDDDNLIYTPGHERIPFNWYKRAVGDEYSVVSFVQGLIDFLPRYPQVLQIGGNTGTVDSFVGIDIANLTGNAYSFPTLLQGNNMACFLYQVTRAVYVDMLNDAVEFLSSVVFTVFGTVLNAQSLLECPQLTGINTNLYSMYPGYMELLPNGSYSRLPQLARKLWPDLRKL